MTEYVPPLTFETLDDGTVRVTDNTIQDAVRDAVKRLADAKETALKEAIKSFGWIAPEDIAAHDAQVAAQALREFRAGLGRRFWFQDPYGHFDPDTVSALHRQVEGMLDAEAERIASHLLGGGS